MTDQVLERHRREGCGEGRYERYQPWIRVRRKQSSPVSRLHILPLPGLRPVHLLSTLEQRYALLAAHLGALEIREQVPWHAEACKHPGFDPVYRHPIVGSDTLAPGLLDSARDLGIDPGVFPGTQIPFVLTTDLVLLVKDGSAHKLVYWPVKPLSELRGPENARRRERVALEERRAADVGAFFHLMTDELVSSQLARNLQAHTPRPETVARYAGSDELHRFAESFNECRSATLFEARAAAGAACGSERAEECSRLFEVALHLGLVDVNASEPLEVNLPVPWGGLVRRKALRRALMGVAA
jgi:hypothetical protein